MIMRRAWIGWDGKNDKYILEEVPETGERLRISFALDMAQSYVDAAFARRAAKGALAKQKAKIASSRACDRLSRLTSRLSPEDSDVIWKMVDDVLGV